MNLKVLVGDREFRISNLQRERKIIAGASIFTGRLLMTLADNGRVMALPPGVVPHSPCRTCGTFKAMNEPCERTPKCAIAQKRAEEFFRGLEQRTAGRVS